MANKYRLARKLNFHRNMAEQMRCSHIIVLSLSLVSDVPNLWITPLELTPQDDQLPCFIYDYYYSSMDDAVH